uniref:Phosducin domain-containing protein n=1 Tax=Spumella elongata TaxID=89044 RepID=A0A7S3GW90_9STRA|mmetsp:Transcript_22762/g.39291  ORF Transcript_22762/g.39291 Transcript_22762/m.39291 type:complete len:304 (+) Transcript_22762:34-945(+)
MGDLEETIFQRNVPGKYSKWDDVDRNEFHDEPTEKYDQVPAETERPKDSDMELLQYAQQLSNAEVPETIRQSILAERARMTATGVKGVLADYRAAQAMAEAEAQAIALHRQQVLTRMTQGAKVQYVAEEEEDETAGLDINDIDSDDLEDDEDDAFMREFRAKRLQELRGASSSSAGANYTEQTSMFGSVKEVRAEDFVQEVEGEKRNVVVVVHLYEPSVQTCIRLNVLLDEIAASQPTIKFLRMQASSNEIVVDRVALPILTVYRGGETIETLAGIAADFGQYFTKADIEWLLSASIPPQDPV